MESALRKLSQTRFISWIFCMEHFSRACLIQQFT